MAESAAAWQQQQKDKAVSSRVTRPDIPGDYESTNIPPIPVTRREGFTSVSAVKGKGVAWPALIGCTTLLLVAISLRQWLK